jgi:hypothetical protein
MGTKQHRWPVARSLAARCFALTLSGSIVAVALLAGSAQAADQKKARDKMVELNKQALLSYEAKDFETARDLLTKALKEAKQAGLEDDKMTARTYLHLGAVYWVGFQDQPVAIQNFSLAKKIRPDIQLTPSIETADLKSVFDMATVEAEPAVPPSHPTAPVRPTPRPTPTAPSGPRLTGGDDGGEPDLPTSMPAPLMCTVPDVVPPNKELTMRCALKPGINAKLVQVHYRTPGVEAYQSLGMRKTAKGWYIVTLPSSMMKAGALQVYFDARGANDNELATNGQVDSPSVIEVRKKSSFARADGECPPDDPMCGIRRQAKAEKYEAGLHRRREGAFWFGLGGGAGWGFVPAGNLEWETHVKVSAMTTTAGLFHLLPEFGYMWSESFGIALQGRIEFIMQQQATYIDPNSKERVQLAGSLTGSPTTMAPAGFLRAIWYLDLSSDGNFQMSISGDLGGGYIRFPVKPVAVVNYDSVKDQYVPDWSKTIAKTDTRPVGMVLGGASAGLIMHLSRHFALALDGRVLTGLPNWGAVVEAALSVQLAFGGVKGPAVAQDDEEVVGGEGGGAPPEEPPTTDLGYEEE